MSRAINTVCVIGAGQMGKQIALNCALHGFEVNLSDSFPAALEAAETWASEYLQGRVKKEKLTQEKADEAKSRIHFVADLADAVKNADLVIEAIIEEFETKKQLFQTLNSVAPKDAIITSNSSFMESSRFAQFIDNPERLANLHFFNPALAMKLTEVVQGEHTSEETVKTLLDFSVKIGKDPVWVRKEIEGFVANRIVRAVMNEALYLLEEGIATAQEIDTAVEKGLNYPMGPFRLMDLTGIDISYLSAVRVLEETGYKKPGLSFLKEKYEAHEWGRKTGKGWYDYSK